MRNKRVIAWRNENAFGWIQRGEIEAPRCTRVRRHGKVGAAGLYQLEDFFLRTRQDAYPGSGNGAAQIPDCLGQDLPDEAMRDSHGNGRGHRSEEHTSELQSLMRSSYAVFCLKKKKELQNKKNMKTTT